MIKKIDTAIDKISFYGILVCVSGMLLLTVLNIVLRWVNTTLLWIDPLVRHLVFLTAFLGGVLATGKDNHIRIDLIGKVLESFKKEGLALWINRVVYLIAMIATGLLAKAGQDFAKMEFEFGKEAFLGIHSGVLTSIIPVGMGLIFIRFGLRLLLTFTKEKAASE